LRNLSFIESLLSLKFRPPCVRLPVKLASCDLKFFRHVTASMIIQPATNPIAKRGSPVPLPNYLLLKLVTPFS
jgi:hypothetical protein